MIVTRQSSTKTEVEQFKDLHDQLKQANGGKDIPHEIECTTDGKIIRIDTEHPDLIKFVKQLK